MTNFLVELTGISDVVILPTPSNCIAYAELALFRASI